METRRPHLLAIGMATDRGHTRVLRAKYLDWCSARIADQFLKLTPDEIFQLAQQVAGKSEEPAVLVPPPTDRPHVNQSTTEPGISGADSPTGSARQAGTSYRALVELVTAALAERLTLPSFEEWRESYRKDPERYESEMSGLWQEPAND